MRIVEVERKKRKKEEINLAQNVKRERRERNGGDQKKFFLFHFKSYSSFLLFLRFYHCLLAVTHSRDGKKEEKEK